MDKKSKMLEIKTELIDNKTLPLYEYRKQNGYHPVIGQGDHDTKIIFIGEAPGENEALSGTPFCGASGRILNELLISIGLQREAVYITNIVKDRPPKNRDPSIEEVEAYSPYLIRQLEIIKPKVIVTLGRHAMQLMLKILGLSQIDQQISVLHGKLIDIPEHDHAQKLLPLYHPAVALYSPSQKKVLEVDFQILKSVID